MTSWFTDMQIIPPTPVSRAAVSGVIFAEDFGDHALAVAAASVREEDSEPPARCAITDEDIARAREEGFAAGFRAGQEEEVNRQALQSERALQQIANRLQDLADGRAEHISRGVEATARLIIASLSTLLPSLSARHAPAEIEQFLRDVMSDLAPNCVVAVSISPELLEHVRSRLSGLPREQAQRVVLRPDDSVPIGDARLAWEGGSASRRAKEVLECVAEILRSLRLLPPAERSAGASGGPIDDPATQPAVAMETENV